MLRGGDGQGLREYLIATAARLIGQPGSAGLTVRDIAREAKVADGALYNYFEDKEDLLAHALLAHVGAMMNAVPLMPPAGTATVAENLRMFIDGGLAVLIRITPAFAGLLAQPKVLRRFHAMVGGDAAFGTGADPGAASSGDPGAGSSAGTGADHGADPGADPGGRGLPAILAAYLGAEQRLGRIAGTADTDAAAKLIVGAIHGEVLPRVLFSPPGSRIAIPPGFAAKLADTVLRGIAPQPEVS